MKGWMPQWYGYRPGLSGGSVKRALGPKKPESIEHLFLERQSSETMVWGSCDRFSQVSGVPREIVRWFGEKNGGCDSMRMSREGDASSLSCPSDPQKPIPKMAHTETEIFRIECALRYKLLRFIVRIPAFLAPVMRISFASWFDCNENRPFTSLDKRQHWGFRIKSLRELLKFIH